MNGIGTEDGESRRPPASRRELLDRMRALADKGSRLKDDRGLDDQAEGGDPGRWRGGLRGRHRHDHGRHRPEQSRAQWLPGGHQGHGQGALLGERENPQYARHAPTDGMRPMGHEERQPGHHTPSAIRGQTILPGARDARGAENDRRRLIERLRGGFSGNQVAHCATGFENSSQDGGDICAAATAGGSSGPTLAGRMASPRRHIGERAEERRAGSASSAPPETGICGGEGRGRTSIEDAKIHLHDLHEGRINLTACEGRSGAGIGNADSGTDLRGEGGNLRPGAVAEAPPAAAVTAAARQVAWHSSTSSNSPVGGV